MSEFILGRAIGQRLLQVEYVLLPWEASLQPGRVIDAVSRAIILRFESVDLQFRWVLKPPVERLIVEPPDALAQAPLTVTLEVGERWPDLLGTRMVGCEFGYQHVESGREPWAALLVFEGGARLLIALGELVDAVPTYLPDSLVITADAHVAQGYTPPASEGSPWR
ncbi:MAG: hypothetical protein WAV45_09440 [Propionibacteriaceae bacterium]|nr:hypothetical protein [Micropruina sp.]HBX81963.1 hypothetical protein [Propionibacteriaceae bacterium]HBY23882.1 hypothetical protein [Propionibacteriaceae bacterium]